MKRLINCHCHCDKYYRMTETMKRLIYYKSLSWVLQIDREDKVDRLINYHRHRY